LRLLAIAVLLIATGVTFSTLLSTDEIPIYRDLLFLIWPLKHFLHERVLQGRLPLWNPMLEMGTPYLANLHSGVFYAPSVLLLLPLPLGFNLFLFTHYVVALFGSWAWLQSRGLGVVPVAIGSAVFTLGGYLVSLLNLTNNLQSAVWAPWVLFFWSRFATGRRPRDFAWLLAALCAELLGGTPEIFLLTLVVLAAWTFYDRFGAWRDVARLFAHLLLACSATVALCAVQIVPTLEYLAQSLRAGALPLEFVTKYSLQPVSALQLLLPHSSALLPTDAANSLGPSFESEAPLTLSYYFGIVPLCLAIVGAAGGRERVFWALLVAVGVAMALGHHAPVFPALYRALPQLFGKFRYPEKFFFLVHLGACVLAAEGAQLVMARRSHSIRMALIASGTLLFIGFLLCLIRWVWPADFLEIVAALAGHDRPSSALVPLAMDTYWKAQRAVFILAALTAIFSLRPNTLRPGLSASLLLALVFGDLVTANRNLNQTMSWRSLTSRAPLIDPVEAQARGERIFHGRTIEAQGHGAGMQNLRLERFMPTVTRSEDLRAAYGLDWEMMALDAGMVYGVANVSESDGMTRVSDNLLMQALSELPLDRALKLLRILGTGYVLGPGPLPAPNVTEIAGNHETPYRAFRIHDPLPLLFTVTNLRAEPSIWDALMKMSADDFDPTRQAIVQALPPGWREDEFQPASLLTPLDRTDDFWRFRVHGAGASFVVVNESFFPGWEARVDGLPATIVPTNALVRGIAVGAGDHLVELAYRPKSFRLGAAISLTSLFVVCTAILSARRRNRDEEPSARS
jgi:hypothetical protein